MKRFVLLSVALVLAIHVPGCGDTGTSPPPAAGPAGADVQPGEAKEYEAKNAKKLAERAEKAAAKSGKSESKNP